MTLHLTFSKIILNSTVLIYILGVMHSHKTRAPLISLSLSSFSPFFLLIFFPPLSEPLFPVKTKNLPTQKEFLIYLKVVSNSVLLFTFLIKVNFPHFPHFSSNIPLTTQSQKCQKLLSQMTWC